MILPLIAFIIWGRSKGGLAGGQEENQQTPHAEAVISKPHSYYKKKKLVKIILKWPKFPSLSANTLISLETTPVF